MKKKIIIFVLISAMLISGTANITLAADETNSLRIGVTQEIDSLSPFLSWSITGDETFMLIYDPLVRVDENMAPVPSLAESWSKSSDNLTWTFVLDENAKWHDGKNVTAEDVKYTYEYIISSGLGMYAGGLEGISSIEAADEKTVVIKTNEPKANMLLSNAPILPKHILETLTMEDLETWSNDSPVGSGPFKFEELNLGGFLKLVKNEDYFKGSPGLDEIIFVLYANDDVMTQALKIGEIDAVVNFSASQLEELKGVPEIEAISAVAQGFTELSFNCSEDSSSKGNKLLLDKNIRQAVEWAIDKQNILDVVYYGQGKTGTSLVPLGDYYHYEPKDELRSFNIEKANELLEKAGYKDTDNDGIREDEKGNKLSFVFTLRSETPEEIKAGQMIAANVEKAGIELKIETVDDGVLIDKIYSQDFDMFIWGWGTALDPTVILNVMSTREIGNLSDCNYSNEEYDRLLLEQQTIMDDSQRRETVYQMQKILYDDAPYIILFYDNNLQAVRTDKFEGWKRVPEDGSYFYNLTYTNYVNVKPKAQTEGTVPEGTQNQGESGSSNTALIVGAVVLLVAGAAVLMMRKKKNTEEDDD
ncbi:MAG TPA: ABC transporter substrate-binding protein [Sedimentibacter sp.]|nr:ABC transporter substrate-binding protein [Sedimentibacter sp.]HOH69214.1 ABC transporter substrate-binding protein [Sedimentibacter sp.]